MDFNIKGITFNQKDLVSVELESLKIGSLSRHHLFHFFGRGKAVLLLRAGDYIESSFVTDYLEKGMLEVKAIEVVKESDILNLNKFFNGYKNAKSERELLEYRHDFFKMFRHQYHNSHESSFLVFVIFFFEDMYNYTDQVLNTYQQTSTVLFARTLRLSTMGVITSILNNFLDWEYLKDFYNTCFMLDFGLVEYGQFHYTLAIACESERRSPGSGIKQLEKLKRPEGERQLFINHPTISYNFAIEHSEKFSNPNLLNIIKIHHEKSDGNGFPSGMTFHELSGFETILTFCDYLVPFNETIYSFGDLQEVFKENLHEVEKLTTADNLPVEDLVSKWRGLVNWLSEQELKEESA